MKASVSPTDRLKLLSSPSSFAPTKASMSGWSQRSTPICAPRRAPADSNVRQEQSKTRMNGTGPEALERVPATQAPCGRMREKS